MSQERDDIFVLTDENGEEQQFEHLDTIFYKDNYYVALSPFIDYEEDLNDDDEFEQEIYIMKVVRENEEDALVLIEDEKELDEVFEEFKSRLDDEYQDDEE